MNLGPRKRTDHPHRRIYSGGAVAGTTRNAWDTDRFRRLSRIAATLLPPASLGVTTSRVNELIPPDSDDDPHAARRDAKSSKRRAMVVSNRSIFVTQEAQRKRDRRRVERSRERDE